MLRINRINKINQRLQVDIGESKIDIVRRIHKKYSYIKSVLTSFYVI